MTARLADCAVPDMRSEVAGLLAQMRSAIKAGSLMRMRQLTDAMEVVTRSYLEPVLPDPVPGVMFTRCEARLVGRLAQGRGGIVTKSQLMDALYFDALGDEPETKIVDIYICKARKKLMGSAYAIQTIHGQGYALKTVDA